MKIKKMLAMLTASTLVLGISVPTYANNVVHTDGVYVKGLESDDLTVTAYQIIKYNEAGYYEPVIPGTISTADEPTQDGRDILSPTGADLQRLASSDYINQLTTRVTLNADESTDEEGDYFTDFSNLSEDVVIPGGWMIIISGSDQYIYNPAIVSVNTTPRGVQYGELNYQNERWSDDIYPKRSEPGITKTAEKENKEDTDIVGVQYGDILKFTVTADIPDYSSDITDITKYIISDKLTGLTLVQDGDHEVTVSVPHVQDVSEISTVIKEAILDGEDSFVADLSDKDTFLINNGGNKIIITYYAKVSSSAQINVDELNNTATLNYSTRGGETSKDATTKHYTFGIDTGFEGTVTTENKTGEFIKINSDGSVGYEENTGNVTVDGEALSGAEFELRIGSSDSSAEKFTINTPDGPKSTFTTDKNGRLEINGLDPDVTYYLVEIKAPSGYTVNSTPVKVQIVADIENGELDGYDVIIGENESQAITHYKYKEGTTTITNTEDTPSNPYGFKNTTLSTLPSTGGIGTTIFTIGGCVIMIAAAGLYFASRRRQENK